MDPRRTDPLDERLHAWFDGELPPDERDEVDAALAEQPALAARVRGWEADRAALRAQLAPVLDEPVPERLARAVSLAAASRPSPLRRLAAAVAIFLLGGVTGAVLVRGLQSPPGVAAEANGGGDGWPRRALVAHAVYAPEQRHPVEVTAAENRAQDNHLVRWLTRRLTVPVKLFDLNAFGFELVGGRLLPDLNGPGAQLMYQDAAGRRVTVYLRKSEPGAHDDPALAAFRYERQGELGLFYWVERGGGIGTIASGAAGSTAQAPRTGYAVVGALPRERLLAIAEAIYRQGRGTTAAR